MADKNNWNIDIPASAFYTIPTGGAKPNEWYERPNTYLSTLGAQRTDYPPVGWDDSPYKLSISPDMLDDPAFSMYDLSQLRSYEQDPRLRDEKDLGIVGTKSASDFAKSPDLHESTAGFTYMPMSPYNPDRVYVDRLNELKMAVGPGPEQTKQGKINKEIASTIAHEFRHNLFERPEYSEIIDDLYNKFGGSVSRYDLEEMVTRAADVQLMPESWLKGTLDSFQKRYNWDQRWTGRPEHLSQINTTARFNQAAKRFFEKVRREKLKRPTQINIQKQKIGMPEHLTTYTPPKKHYGSPPGPHGSGDKGTHSTQGRDRGRSRGRGETGQIAGGHHFNRGGLIDFYRYGGFVG